MKIVKKCFTYTFAVAKVPKFSKQGFENFITALNNQKSNLQKPNLKFKMPKYLKIVKTNSFYATLKALSGDWGFKKKGGGIRGASCHSSSTSPPLKKRKILNLRKPKIVKIKFGFNIC